MASARKLIVVANRLPVTITPDPTVRGGYVFTPSSGGLASALSGCKKDMQFTWIGWPGFDVPEIDRPDITKRLATEFSCIPVYLSNQVAERYYNGFSNSILWPLFHYHPGEITFDETDWLAYRQANLLFAEVVRKQVESRDIVWVQDYHLMLVPLFLRDLLGRDPASMGESSQSVVAGMFDGLVMADDTTASPIVGPGDSPASFGSTPSPLSGGGPGRGRFVSVGASGAPSGLGEIGEDSFGSRDGQRAGSRISGSRNGPAGVNGSHGRVQVPEVQIGFFLHTPFPSSEVFRVLPVRREILLGILNCDLIGFHTYDYARHFLSSVTRLLGLKCLPNSVELVGRHATVGTFPIGIDPTQFFECLETDSVISRIAALRRRFSGVKIIVGVDRLDYIKGVPQKLHALEVFLSENPSYIGKVVLIQLAIPSRQDVEEYQNLRADVNELVGRINGRFGTVEFMPIHFMHRSIGFQELCALYAVSDVCMISSTRDGMNLVSYEYIACQKASAGVLILSEFAGAAHSLNGSIIVNPWNTNEMANAIKIALEMDQEQRKGNYRKLFGYVTKFTAARWGVTFVAELQRLSNEARAMADAKLEKSDQLGIQRLQRLKLTARED